MPGRSRANAAATTPTARNGSTVVSCSEASSRSATPMTITSRTNVPPVTTAARSSFASTLRLILNLSSSQPYDRKTVVLAVADVALRAVGKDGDRRRGLSGRQGRGDLQGIGVDDRQGV